MLNLYSLTRPLVALSAIAILVLATACSKATDTGPASAASSATSQTNSAPQARVASQLGDLSAFQKISEDVSSIVDKGDLSEAKTRIKDLEVTWDAAVAGLKPRAADDWHKIDKLIDHALRATRAESPNLNECKKAMTDLLIAFNSFQGKL